MAVKLFDSHFHIINKAFPLIENQGFLPDEYTLADYRQQTQSLDLKIAGGAVVSGSFQGFDQGYLIDTLKQLGPGFVGVSQLPASTTNEEIMALHHAGVRAVRFNLYRGGSEAITNIESFAKRIHELAGWHVELYVDAAELEPLTSVLQRLPRVSIDHLGLSKAGLTQLLKLVEHGARVKATGFGRVDLDVGLAMQQIVAINPDALIFGTDLPCTRAARAFDTKDIELIRDRFDDRLCKKIFFQNGCDWYRPQQPA